MLWILLQWLSLGWTTCGNWSQGHSRLTTTQWQKDSAMKSATSIERPWRQPWLTLSSTNQTWMRSQLAKVELVMTWISDLSQKLGIFRSSKLGEDSSKSSMPSISVLVTFMASGSAYFRKIRVEFGLKCSSNYPVLCQFSKRNLRYVDCHLLGDRKTAVGLRHFRDLTKRMTNDVRGLLVRKWLKGIQRTLVAVNSIFTFIETDAWSLTFQAANKNLVPKADDLQRMISFFHAVATLMEQNLETLFHDSVAEYKDFILCILVKFTHLLMNHLTLCLASWNSSKIVTEVPTKASHSIHHT